MKNKFIKAFAAVTTIFSLLSVNCLSANAKGNIDNTSWVGGSPKCDEFNSYNGQGRGCIVRSKTDTTSIYVWNTSETTSKVTVWGESSKYSFAKIDPTWCDGYTTLYTNKWSVPKQAERLIPQYIGERSDLSYAHVHFTTIGTKGYWSPDSVGWYPNANIDG